MLWEHVKGDVVFSEDGYVIFDDTVLEKRNTKKIEIARKQYSGAKGNVTTGRDTHGPDCSLTKPFDPDQIVALTSEVLGIDVDGAY